MTTTFGRRARLLGTALGALTLLSACAVGPDYERPSAPVPPAYKEGGVTPVAFAPAIPRPAIPREDGWRPAAPGQAASGPWWTVFRDPVLDGLMQRVEVDNQSLKAAEAAYRQAKALADQARSAFFPLLSVSGGADRAGTVGSGNRSVSGISGSRSGTPVTTYDVGLGASWAPDLWGRIRRSVESNDANLQASAADLAAARLSAQAQLATAYFQLRVADERKALLERAIAAYRQSLEIARNRHAVGTATLADVFTAETQVRSTESQLVALGVQRAQLEHAIAVLVGQTPAAFALAPAPLTATVPDIPPGVPSALLERRPDIAAAERQMAQANAQIGIAESAWYPDVLLTGSLSNSATILPKLLQAPTAIWAVGAQVAQTLFDGGTREAEVELRRAVFDQSVAQYRQTVLTAFQEVEDQLAAQRILAQQAAVQDDAVRLAREAERLTLNQYRAGTLPYSSVLTSQTAALSDEESALSVRQSRLLAAVSLLQALGGAPGGNPPNF